MTDNFVLTGQRGPLLQVKRDRGILGHLDVDPWMVEMKEICPRGNNNIVIIIFLVHDNVYIPC
jgi:hypothetical protein